ncbi:MAG: hypothetical protein V1720_13645 [bacterium]
MSKLRCKKKAGIASTYSCLVTRSVKGKSVYATASSKSIKEMKRFFLNELLFVEAQLKTCFASTYITLQLIIGIDNEK